MWYAAHAIFYLRKKGRRRQKLYLVHENVYLVNAATPKDAFNKAAIFAKEECVNDPTLTFGGVPADYVFAGFRKLVPVFHRGRATSLRSGDELTYSAFHVSRMTTIKRLAAGRSADVSYID